MLNMKEKAVLVIICTLAAVLTASLIRASLTHEVELVLNPNGSYVTAPAGEPFNISCQALGGNKSKCFMQWLDSEENVIGEGIPGVVQDENNSLLLTFTDPKCEEDSGAYTCTAVCDNENNWQYAVNIVFYGEPKFKTDFENKTVMEGQKLEVFCSAESNDIIAYKWYNQSGDEITDEEGSVYASSRWYGSWLVIKEAKFHHEGMYTCSANNSFGLSSSKLYYIGVSPNPRPEFKIDFENLTVIEGQRVEVYCRAESESSITYKWYNQSGDEITEKDGAIFASNRWFGSYLYIKEAKFHHEGMYTCRANTSYVSASKLYYIGVSPKPDITVLNVSANSVQFRIVVSGFVEGIEVMYKFRQTNRTNFTRAADNIYSFENLVPNGLYEFRFRILPLNGNTEWLETLQVILLPDMPEIIIRRVDKNSIEFQLFRTSNDVLRETIDKYEIKYYSLQTKQSGDFWIPFGTCAITIELPSCSAASHTISGLQQGKYYQIEIRAHTDSGYGEPAKQKIYIPR